MASHDTTPAVPSKQITIEVPEDRVAEFYAVVGRFLAGRRGRRGRHGHGHGHGHGPGGCRSRHAGRGTEERGAVTEV